MWETLIAAMTAFIGTNLDDLLVLLLLYTKETSPVGRIHILIGKLLGIAALAGVSWLGAGVLRVWLLPYVNYLGIIPILMGVRAWFTYQKAGTQTETRTATSVWAVVLLTIANGGDNLSIYLPLFSRGSGLDGAVTLTVFLLLTIVWCLMGRILAEHPLVRNWTIRIQHVLVPAALVALGVFILIGM